MAAEFVRKLVEQAETLTVGDPLAATSTSGPVIDEAAVETFERGVAEAQSAAPCTAAASG